jgi:hypothetical protein
MYARLEILDRLLQAIDQIGSRLPGKFLTQFCVVDDTASLLTLLGRAVNLLANRARMLD